MSKGGHSIIANQSAHLPEVPGLGVDGDSEVLLEDTEEVAVRRSVDVKAGADINASSEGAVGGQGLAELGGQRSRGVEVDVDVDVSDTVKGVDTEGDLHDYQICYHRRGTEVLTVGIKCALMVPVAETEGFAESWMSASYAINTSVHDNESVERTGVAGREVTPGRSRVVGEGELGTGRSVREIDAEISIGGELRGGLCVNGERGADGQDSEYSRQPRLLARYITVVLPWEVQAGQTDREERELSGGDGCLQFMIVSHC